MKCSLFTIRKGYRRKQADYLCRGIYPEEIDVWDNRTTTGIDAIAKRQIPFNIQTMSEQERVAWEMASNPNIGDTHHRLEGERYEHSIHWAESGWSIPPLHRRQPKVEMVYVQLQHLLAC